MVSFDFSQILTGLYSPYFTKKSSPARKSFGKSTGLAQWEQCFIKCLNFEENIMKIYQGFYLSFVIIILLTREQIDAEQFYCYNRENLKKIDQNLASKCVYGMYLMVPTVEDGIEVQRKISLNYPKVLIILSFLSLLFSFIHTSNSFAPEWHEGSKRYVETLLSDTNFKHHVKNWENFQSFANNFESFLAEHRNKGRRTYKSKISSNFCIVLIILIGTYLLTDLDIGEFLSMSRETIAARYKTFGLCEVNISDYSETEMTIVDNKFTVICALTDNLVLGELMYYMSRVVVFATILHSLRILSILSMFGQIISNNPAFKNIFLLNQDCIEKLLTASRIFPYLYFEFLLNKGGKDGISMSNLNSENFKIERLQTENSRDRIEFKLTVYCDKGNKVKIEATRHFTLTNTYVKDGQNGLDIEHDACDELSFDVFKNVIWISNTELKFNSHILRLEDE